MTTNVAPVFGVRPAGVSVVGQHTYTSSGAMLVVRDDGSIVVIGSQPGPSPFGIQGGVPWVTLWARADGSDSQISPNYRVDLSPNATAVQADGKILVAGIRIMGTAYVTGVARFNADGTADTTFGAPDSSLPNAPGHIFIAPAGSDEEPTAIAVLPDGKIIVAGATSLGAPNGYEPMLIRLNADGTLDTSFHGTGKYVIPTGASSDSVVGMEVTADSHLLVLVRSIGTADRSLHLMRFDEDGVLDPAFGSGGVITEPVLAQFGSTATGMTTTTDGKIVVFGTETTGPSTARDTSVFLMRFTADGALDTSFGNSGKTSAELGNFAVLNTQIVQQPDGKFLVAGMRLAADGSSEVGEVVRLNADGSLDTSFGHGGVASMPGTVLLGEFVLNGDGSILAAGTMDVYSSAVSSAPVLVRILSDGTLDGSYAPGDPFVGFAYADVHGGSVELAPGAGVFDEDLHVAGSYAGATLTVARHGGAMAGDVFGFDGAVTLSGSTLSYNGRPVATEFSSGGTLKISFLSPPLTGLPIESNFVNIVIQHITWQSGAQAAGATAGFDWTFDDGSGAANSSVTATSTVLFANVLQAGADGHVSGTSGNDVFIAGSGSDTLNGGAGALDVAVFHGPRAAYTIDGVGNGQFTVSFAQYIAPTASVNMISHSLTSIERIQFDDAQVALDIDGNAGKAYRLYQAAFDRTPDIGGLGFQMHDLDIGITLEQVAGNFIRSPEFQSTYGSVDDPQFIELLYRNVLHRASDAGGMQFHLDELAHGQTRADLLIHFSESPENQANVIGQIQDGMLYSY